MAAVVEASEGRRPSRSPRGGRRAGGADADGGSMDDGEEALPEWDGSGPAPGERSFMGQLSQHRAFLEQVLNPRRQPQEAFSAGGRVGAPPKELAAGLPLEAARALMFLGPETDGAPWTALPPELACVAAALRLFARLMPGRAPPADEDACARFCAEARAGKGLHLAASSAAAAAAAVESLEASAAAWGLDARRVPSPTESLKAMVANRPTVCCACLQAYVGVVEDPASGEELEHEVGIHCVMVVGGDLLGTSHVTFDPFGLRGGDVAYWSAHSLDAAAPVAWVELSPALA